MKNCVQRNKFIFNSANILYKKAPYLAQIPPYCAINHAFFPFLFRYNSHDFPMYVANNRWLFN